MWLVDPVDRTLEAFELRDRQWVLIAGAKDDDPVSTPPFDAVTFGLGDLWPRRPLALKGRPGRDTDRGVGPPADGASPK